MASRMTHIHTHDLTHFEVITTDVEGTKSFYAKAFGWKFQTFGPEMGNYVMGNLPNGTTCGIRVPDAGEKPGILNYVLVKDINAAVKDAKALGATIVAEPSEIPGMGWMAVYLVGGVPNAIWQSAQR